MPSDRGAQIMEQARGMGAAMAGIANVELLKRSPSHQITEIRHEDRWRPLV
jgi:hypothetical protein